MQGPISSTLNAKRPGSSAVVGQTAQPRFQNGHTNNGESLNREKETQLMYINSEILKFDINEMRDDTLHKVYTIANNLTKTERQIFSDERKNLRYLERVGAMQRALIEDHQSVSDSLKQTERLKERAKKNFDIIDKENQEE